MNNGSSLMPADLDPSVDPVVAPAADAPTSVRSVPVPLFRHVLGASLRQYRLGQGRTLRQVSRAAQVSLGYLSEIERGQKEASSELLSAICDALAVPLSDVLVSVAAQIAVHEGRGATLVALAAPASAGVAAA